LATLTFARIGHDGSIAIVILIIVVIVVVIVIFTVLVSVIPATIATGLNQMACAVGIGPSLKIGKTTSIYIRDAPDIRPDKTAFFDIRYPAGYQIAQSDIRPDIR
jgi:hypothetical protein